MKKYAMLALTIIMICATGIIYLFQHSTNTKEYKAPVISFKSNKYGTITNIIWSPVNNQELYFLSNDGKSSSTIGKINIDKLEAEDIIHFSSHKNIKDFLAIDNSRSELITASQDGLLYINIQNKDKAEANYQAIPDFQNAANIAIGSNVIFMTNNNKIVNLSDINSPFNNPGFFSATNMRKSLYYPASNILPSIGGPAFYSLRAKSNGFSLYQVYINNEGLTSKLIGKNILNPKSGEYNMRLCGLVNNKDNYDKFQSELDKKIIINTIPKNNDVLGQLPDVELTRNGAVYTKYDDRHYGSIILQGYGEIVKAAPLVGPIRFSNSDQNDNLLFFTYEAGKTYIKVCLTKENKIIDITKSVQ